VNLYELKGLKQVFDDRTVLDIEHLALSQGGGHALLGPNGCGKTTLLHILAFLRPPAAGQVLFRGQLVDWREKFLRRLRRQVVLVEQHPIMFTTTVLKNVEYGLRMRGIHRRERRRIAEECLERVGMRQFASRPAHTLSGGENQRVAIARALACGPEVLLFDEPTAGVDVENQAAIETIIRDLRREKGITVIFSTHKRLEAAKLGENKIFLFEGKVSGPGGENLLSGNVVRRGGRTLCMIGEKFELDVAATHEGPCRVFVKPEGVRIYSLKQAEKIDLDGLVSGRVLQMTSEGDRIKALLDVGIPIRTIMTRKEALESGILVGDEVKVAFETGAAQIRPRHLTVS
jgi:tungstate transport system ATP-binding protein